MLFVKSDRKKIIEKITLLRNPKDEKFNFDLIEHYFRKKDHTSAFQVINDKTIQDIDFYDLFTYIDRTNSKIGQQYLFNKLLTIERDTNFDEFEQIIKYFQKNDKESIKARALLSKLNTRESYFVSNLYQDEYIQQPKWFWVVKILSILSALVFVCTFILPKLFIILVVIIISNFLIHYWNKRNIYIYTDSIPQLLLLCENTFKLIKLNIPIQNGDSIVESIRSIRKFKNRMTIFTIETKSNSGILAILWAILEYIKILFLIEPLIVFNVLKSLNNKRKDIQKIFEYFGKIDSAISIATIRETSQYYCNPTISDKSIELEFVEIYHPLIPNCVSNSLKIHNKSVLLTGSNMSGKTTFLRTIALNSLLAQTINTCFAKSFNISPMRLFSAIRITDDLLNSKSYYFEEVLTIKNMIDESQFHSTNLFLLDEIFKGTNTIERIAAGKAVLSYIAKSNLVFVSTHDIEMTDLLWDSYDLYHFTELVENRQIHFDYKLKSGNLATRNAIRILEINNYPKQVIEEAKEISMSFQKQANKNRKNECNKE